MWWSDFWMSEDEKKEIKILLKSGESKEDVPLGNNF